MPTTYAIPDGRTVMAATLYTGNSSTQTISNAVNGVGMQPDLVWIKDRTAAQWNNLTDSVRGVGKELFSNATNAEETNNGISSLNSNGFSLINWDGANKASDAYVAWQWKAGGTAVSNTAGSITSSVSANTTAGFSVVTYTGTGANATVGHGLGVAPSFIIVKSRSVAGSNWPCYHVSTGNLGYNYLNLTLAVINNATYWNSTSPTSTVFSLGSDGANNQSSATFVAYCFSAVAGYSAFGSYTGNGTVDNVFLYTGFRPAFFIVKCTSTTGSWLMFDNARPGYNSGYYLLANSTFGGNGSDNPVDFLSNGIKIRADGGIGTGTHIYAAFASNPFKYANAG